ncbi:MAG: DNA-3-methyladenine glycosylase family protein [Actinomycetota bacterium]
MPRVSAAAATAEVARRDPVMAGLIERAGPLAIRPPRDPDAFVELAQAIAYQQLAGRAAAAIWGRVAGLFDGAMTPERVLATPDEAFRAAGFSASKTRSVKDLAAKAATGEVPLDRLRRMRDPEVVARLSEVRGIGRWTAEMFLIFTLRRMDVWPVLDYGVRNGYRIAYGLPEVPTPKELEPQGDRFRPYRTVAAWYCWRAVELGPGRG